MILLVGCQLAGFATASAGRGQGLSGPSPGPELVVAITEDSLEAVVTESQPGLATFHGTATVQMPTVRGAEVTLTSSTDIGWVSQVNPSTLTLSNGQTGEFTVTVSVPQGSASTQTGNLMVYGRAVASGVQASAEDTALVKVKQYCRISLDAVRRTVEMAPGGTARFSLRLTNAGNGIDSFALEFPNKGDLRKQGWSVELTNVSLAKVTPGEYRLVTVSLGAPVALSPYLDRETTLAVKASSLAAREQGQNATLDYSLVARETGASTPGIGAVALVAAVVAVAVVVYWRRKRRVPADAPPSEPPQSPGENG